jgi:predicted site-specific integrase-resolvase
MERIRVVRTVGGRRRLPESGVERLMGFVELISQGKL